MQIDRPLSPHFRLSELTTSQTAVRAGPVNEADPTQLANLTRLCVEHAEPIRAALGGVPVVISSGLRTWLVNGLVTQIISVADIPAVLLGERPHLAMLCWNQPSAHRQGLAMDFTAPAFGTPRQIAARLRDAGLPFDQLIYERGWVHYGIAAEGAQPRGDVLTAIFKAGEKTRYARGLIG